MAKKKRPKPRELTQEAVDRGIYQDILLRQGNETALKIFWRKRCRLGRRRTWRR